MCSLGVVEACEFARVLVPLPPLLIHRQLQRDDVEMPRLSFEYFSSLLGRPTCFQERPLLGTLWSGVLVAIPVEVTLVIGRSAQDDPSVKQTTPPPR